MESLPRDTDMTLEEIDGFLSTRHYGAVGTIAPDGGPRVVPVTFEGTSTGLVLKPSVPGGSRAAMNADETERFLRDFRYSNEFSTAPFVAAATRRKDGSPLVVPFGYIHHGGAIYLTVNNARAFHHRVRREPRIALGVFSAQPPLRAVVATGVAEEVDDPGHEISRMVFRRQMEAYTWLDFESYLAKWLAAGRTVYRVRPETIAGWTDDEEDAPAELEGGEEVPRVSFAAYSESAPTVVALLAGRAVARPRGEGGGYELNVEARSAWDSRKQTNDRWEKGRGSHVEGGTWLPVTAR